MAAAALRVVSNDLEAEMLCGMLRTSGIDSWYEKTDAGGPWVMNTITSQAGPTTVYVDQAQLEEARKLLPDRP